MFARFFIDRPVFAWVLSLVVILVGAVAAFFLPIDQYPNITPPTIQVSATYPGADAMTVANTVAAPLEEQINGVENMLYMSSQSSNDGTYTLTITFAIGTDQNTAQVLVENRVTQALPLLPTQVQQLGVTTIKRSPSILLAVSLVSPDGRYDDLYMSNYATIQLRDQILRVPGVGDVMIFGVRDYSMRVWLSPDQLATRNLTAVDVVNAIQNQNVEVAAGQIGQPPVPRGQALQLPMRALGRLETPQQFADIIIKAGNGPAPPPGDTTSSVVQVPSGSAGVMSLAGPVPQAIVRLRDVAKVEMGALNYGITSRLDGQPSTGMGVFQLPGSNALAVARSVREMMQEAAKSFPPGLEYRILYDTTPFVRQSLEEVGRTLLIAVLLVAAVVLLFLQDWKAMILPMIDVPVSLVGTFAVMALLGFSFNILTLFGLVLAIGIVVDDAIVVLENIERLMAKGMEPREATLEAMREITGPIIAITLVLCAVFVPSFFIPGLTGQFYRQFAVTIATAMVISAINAMTLTPSRAVAIFRTESKEAGGELHKEALPWWIFGVIGGCLTLWLLPGVFAGRFGLPADLDQLPDWSWWGLQLLFFLPGAIVGGIIGWFIIGGVNRLLGRLFRGFNRVFDRITHGYGWAVGKLMRVGFIVLVVYLGLLGLTTWMFIRAPTGFLPEQDQGYLLANVQLPDSASAQRTEDIMRRLDVLARNTPGVAHTVGISGQSFVLGTTGSNLGAMFIVLKPWQDRSSTDLGDVAIAQHIQQQAGRELSGAAINIFRAPAMRGLGNAGGFQLQVEQRGYVDLPRLEAQTNQLIARANADGRFAGVFTQFRAATPQLFVDIDRAKAELLNVPLGDVFSTLQVFMGGRQVNQFNRFGRTWWVDVMAAPQYRTNPDVLKRLQVRSSQGAMVPFGTLANVEPITGPVVVMRYNMYASAPVNGAPAPGVSSGQAMQAMTQLADELHIPFEWTQINFLQQQAGNVGILAFGLATVLVYLILAAKYESWRLPLAVILVVPLCILAALTGLWIVSLPVDIFVDVGLLVLIGLASKNAILIVEFARQRRMEGARIEEAAHEGSVVRFRPIIMTSLAFTLGVVPLVIATGAGKEMRQVLGTAVFAGMIGVTIFGVFLTPVLIFDLLRLRGGDKIAAPPVDQH